MVRTQLERFPRVGCIEWKEGDHYIRQPLALRLGFLAATKVVGWGKNIKIDDALRVLGVDSANLSEAVLRESYRARSKALLADGQDTTELNVARDEIDEFLQRRKLPIVTTTENLALAIIQRQDRELLTKSAEQKLERSVHNVFLKRLTRSKQRRNGYAFLVRPVRRWHSL